MGDEKGEELAVISFLQDTYGFVVYHDQGWTTVEIYEQKHGRMKANPEFEVYMPEAAARELAEALAKSAGMRKG